METKDIILELRTKNHMSQDDLAERVFVTRQAVSRWETGDTVPNTETLKLLSKLFDVSINTLLARRGSSFASAAVCRLTTRPSARSRAANSTRNTANGATTTVILSTRALISSRISSWSICRMRIGRRSRRGLILRKICQN